MLVCEKKKWSIAGYDLWLLLYLTVCTAAMRLNKIDLKKKSFHPCVIVWVLYAFGGLVSSPDGHLSDPAAASAPSSPRAPRRPPPGGSLQPQKERTLRWAEIKGRQWATFVCNTARAIIAKLPGQTTKLQPEAKINWVEKVSVAAAVTRWHSMDRKWAITLRLTQADRLFLK